MAALTKRQVRQGLDNGIKDGVFTGAATGIVNTYLTPYALALGASAAQIGLLSALPQFASTVLQPLAGSMVEHSGSMKKMCRALVLLSRLAMIPVIWVAFERKFDAFSLLLVFVSISTALASFARIAWVSWMGSIVPEKIRGMYFGKRNMFIGMSSLVVTLAAGWFLGFTDTLAGFAVIFSVALMLFFWGYGYLMRMPEPVNSPAPAKGSKRNNRNHTLLLNPFEFLSSMKKANFRRFMTYVIFFDFSVFLASPFFTVYMISELKIGYSWFAVVTAASALSAILSQRYWGKLSDRYGDRTVMAICSALASMVPLLFVFSRDPSVLILVNIFSGFAWSGLDLVIFNFLLDSSPPEKRPLFVSNYQFFDGIAIAGGSVAGSIIVSVLGAGIFGFSAVAAVFVLAAFLRAVFTITLIPRIKEERANSEKKLPARDMFLNAVVIYPVRGVSHQAECIYRRVRRLDRIAGKGIKKVFGRQTFE